MSTPVRLIRRRSAKRFLAAVGALAMVTAMAPTVSATPAIAGDTGTTETYVLLYRCREIHVGCRRCRTGRRRNACRQLRGDRRRDRPFG